MQISDSFFFRKIGTHEYPQIKNSDFDTISRSYSMVSHATKQENYFSSSKQNDIKKIKNP